MNFFMKGLVTPFKSTFGNFILRWDAVSRARNNYTTQINLSANWSFVHCTILIILHTCDLQQPVHYFCLIFFYMLCLLVYKRSTAIFPRQTQSVFFKSRRVLFIKLVLLSKMVDTKRFVWQSHCSIQLRHVGRRGHTFQISFLNQISKKYPYNQPF